MNCLIIDDEHLAIELVEDNLHRLPYLKLVGKAIQASDAYRILAEEQVDLIFLDVQMPGMTGLQFLRSLKDPPMVILLTAFERYALESYELNVVDYLLKPCSFERFAKATQKALDLHQQKSIPQTKEDNFLFVYSEYNLVKVAFEDVDYIQGLKDYIKIIRRSDPKPLLTRSSLGAIEARLPLEKFIRCHRSYIVSLNAIDSIRKGRIRIGEQEIPVSEGYRIGLENRITPHRLN